MAKGKFAIGAILGAAAGVVAGLLTAPKAGKDTRDDIKRKADELKYRAGKKADDVKRAARGLRAETQDVADDVAARAERSVRKAKETIEKKR